MTLIRLNGEKFRVGFRRFWRDFFTRKTLYMSQIVRRKYRIGHGRFFSWDSQLKCAFSAFAHIIGQTRIQSVLRPQTLLFSISITLSSGFGMTLLD